MPVVRFPYFLMFTVQFRPVCFRPLLRYASQQPPSFHFAKNAPSADDVLVFVIGAQTIPSLKPCVIVRSPFDTYLLFHRSLRLVDKNSEHWCLTLWFVLSYVLILFQSASNFSQILDVPSLILLYLPSVSSHLCLFPCNCSHDRNCAYSLTLLNQLGPCSTAIAWMHPSL